MVRFLIMYYKVLGSSPSEAMMLMYSWHVAEQLVGYMDVDWARNASDHRSTYGFAFSLGSVVIAWSSKKQPTVALSSTEPEYRGAAIATCKAIWVKRLLKDLQVEVSGPTTIYCNNLHNIQLEKRGQQHAKPSHSSGYLRICKGRCLVQRQSTTTTSATSN